MAGLKLGQAGREAGFRGRPRPAGRRGAFENVSYRYTAAASGEGIAATLEVARSSRFTRSISRTCTFPRWSWIGTARQGPALLAREAPRHPARPRALHQMDPGISWPRRASRRRFAASVLAAPGGEFNIVFRPAKPLPTVAQVTFEGNQVLPQEKLREAIAGAVVGASYTEDSFRQTLNSVVRPLYENQGPPQSDVSRAPHRKGHRRRRAARIRDRSRGRELRPGKSPPRRADADGAGRALKAGELRARRFSRYVESERRVEQVRRAIRREGYMEVRVSADRKMDDEKKTANVVVHVLAGPQFTMGN